MTLPLVRNLFDCPLDIVGDVHGEIDALRDLMDRLGYSEDGLHPAGRRLVFLGDLTDRGPDSLAVVELVQRLTEADRAQCVLGNHDLNILLGHEKPENKWFFGEEFTDKEGRVSVQRLASAADRNRICAFFATLPLALKRDDIRVVHACWDSKMIDVARASCDAEALYEQYKQEISSESSARHLDETDEKLEHQNFNPVKLLTSGPEERTETPFESGGKLRHERRVQWWNDYTDPEYCVFGHYASPLGEPHGMGRAICVDYGVGKRWEERIAGSRVPHRYKLGAFRYSEIKLVFDDGDEVDLSEVRYL